MRVALVAPDWGNSWIPMIQAEVERRGHEFKRSVKGFVFGEADIYLHAWADGSPIGGARNVMFLRRYELFNGALAKIDWANVQDLILCNTWIKSVVDRYFEAQGIKTRTHLIYNAVDTSAWTFRDRAPSKNIGMVCSIHPKKNIPLALEVMANTQMEYELHIAGQIQDPCTAEYLNYMGKRLRRKIVLYGHIPREDLDFWWEQMGFCLCTSISEGNPNNVLEAMAKGIMPIIHEWPGASDQFPDDLLFKTAFGAGQILSNTLLGKKYDSSRYLELVKERYSLDNIRQVVDIALEETQQGLS